MNKLIFILFLNIYAFHGFSNVLETDPLKAFDNLKINYPVMPQKDSADEKDFDNELVRITGLFDPNKIDNKINDLLEKMTIPEIEKLEEIIYDVFYSTKSQAAFRAFNGIIKQYCKNRLDNFLQDFQGFDTFDFSSPQLNELVFLINRAPQHTIPLFIKKDITKMLKAIVNFSYKDLASNLNVFNLLREALEGLDKYRWSSYNSSQEDIILAEQARFKLTYLIGKENNLQDIVKSDLPKRHESFGLKNTPFDVIYNNDGYSSNEYKTFIKGESIKDENTPVGYVIFVPKKDIKNIVIDMYGGWEKKDLLTRLNEPSNYLSNFERSILDNGTVLIQLNLPDLLENDVNQKALSLKLLFKIHAAVDLFYEIVKNTPTQIHDSLEILRDKPTFLMGSSFGGMMSVFHAIRFRGTFTGYISHAGALFGQAAYDNKYTASYLKVADINKIKKIEDPVFIHHSLDDNRVNVKASLEFYRLAKAANKDHLVKLFIDEHGTSVFGAEPGLHGHFFPEDYYLKVFSEQLIDFINSSGKNINPLLNEWRYEKFTKIAHRLEGLGSYAHKEQKRDLHNVLLSKGVEYCNFLIRLGDKDDLELIKNSKLGDAEAFDKLWSTNIAPYLWQISIEESLRTTKDSDFNAEVSPASLNMRLELKNALEDDVLLKEVIKIMLTNSIYSKYEELIITDNFIDNVFKDVDDWLNDDKEYENTRLMSNISKAFLSVIIDKKIFDIMLKKQAPSALAIINDNTKLKEDLLLALKEQRLKAIKVIRDKITKDPEKVKELLKSYR